jgi:hypothetical protein
LNYCVRVARNKEIVINVNKMKRCFPDSNSLPTGGQARPHSSSGATHDLDGPDKDGDEPETYGPPGTSYIWNEPSIPSPAMTEPGTREDRTRDPTWIPSQHYRTQVPEGEGAVENRDIMAEHGYFLRSRNPKLEVGITGMPLSEGGDDEEVGRPDLDEVEASPPPSPAAMNGSVADSNEIREDTPCYNLRPLPGRRN